MKTIYFLLLLPGLLFFSCGEYQCTEAQPSISFIGFQNNETDTVIVRRYLKSTNFTSLVDSSLVYATNSSYQRSTDTLEIFHFFGTDDGFLSKYDYEVYLPKNLRLFRINDIAEEFRSIKKGLSSNKVGCINFIRSYRLNGGLISGQNNYQSFYLIR